MLDPCENHLLDPLRKTTFEPGWRKSLNQMKEFGQSTSGKCARALVLASGFAKVLLFDLHTVGGPLLSSGCGGDSQKTARLDVLLVPCSQRPGRPSRKTQAAQACPILILLDSTCCSARVQRRTRPEQPDVAYGASE